MKVGFSKPEQPNTGTYVVLVMDDRRLSQSAASLDKKTNGVITRAMGASRFKGNRDQVLDIMAVKGVPYPRILLLGVGKPEKLDAPALQGLGATLISTLNAAGESVATVSADTLPGAPLQAADLAAQIAYGARLRAYRFDRYKTREKDENKPTLKMLNLLVTDVAGARKSFAPLDRIADAVYLTRDVVSEPPNVIFPAALAERCKHLSALGVRVEVLDEKAIARLGMGALIGVAQGSARPPRVVVLQWNGAPRAKDKRPVAFCGKGVCFDTGGISLKPAGGMEDMKWDMAGAGAVIGAIAALAGRRAKVNAVGVIGLVENMPDGNAQRPSDIVKSMSGRTIEVLNTDAEGRLVLADVCWYTQDRFKPKAMVDLATLTGAIIVTLGHEYAGIFANNDDLAAKLVAAGGAVGEKLWRLPLGEVYDRDIDSDVADVKNIGSNRQAGSIIGAVFIQRFVNDTPWAHLDIAGVAWGKKDQGVTPKGATGYGVRLLDRFVADNYEEHE